MSHRMNKKAIRQARFNRAEDKLSLMIPGSEQHTDQNNHIVNRNKTGHMGMGGKSR
jgi:hypothetical protein